MTDNINDVMSRLSEVIFKPPIKDQAERGEWCFDLSKLCDADAVRLKALLSYTKQCREALEAQPVAWARRWFIDGEVPKKERNENGRMAWPRKFTYHEVTVSKVSGDDYPLCVRQALSTQPGERG